MSTLTLRLPVPAQTRLPELDELKGLAIILVVLYHAGGTLIWQNLLHGDVGVDMFVILSGIGLTLGASYSNARSFLMRRFSRIMPTYWVALALYWTLNRHFLELNYSALDVGLHILGVHAFFGDQYAMSINASFWFISLILLLYCLYCVLRPWLAQPDRMLFLGSVISVGLAVIYYYWNQPSVFGHLALRVPGFFVGLLIGETIKRGSLEIPLGWPLGLALFIWFYVPYPQGIIFYSPLVALAVMLAYSHGLRPVLVAGGDLALRKMLGFFGRYSLEIFVLHQPLIREYVYYCLGRFCHLPQPTSAQLIGGMIVGFFLTIELSILLRRLISAIPLGHKGSPAS